MSAEELLVSAAKSRKGVLAVIGLGFAFKSPALMQASVVSLEQARLQRQSLDLRDLRPLTQPLGAARTARVHNCKFGRLCAPQSFRPASMRRTSNTVVQWSQLAAVRRVRGGNIPHHATYRSRMYVCHAGQRCPRKSLGPGTALRALGKHPRPVPDGAKRSNEGVIGCCNLAYPTQ